MLLKHCPRHSSPDSSKVLPFPLPAMSALNPKPNTAFPLGVYPHHPLQPPSMHATLNSMLDQFPDERLGDLQNAFLAGEGLEQFYASPPSPDVTGDLAREICWSLSASGSLRNRSGQSPPSQVIGTTVMSTMNTIVQGYSQTLCEGMNEFRGSFEHHTALKDAIEAGPEYLACDKLGVRISNHVDFGLKRAGWPSTDNRPQPYGKVPQYFRTIVIVNGSHLPMVLLDICGIPAIDHIFVLHDDFRLAHHYHQISGNSVLLSNSESSKGVVLQPGAQYQVTVELQCSSEDCSFHQQWLVFTFAKGGGKIPTDYTTGDSIFMIGRRVSALVVKHVQDVQNCLSTEAKPYYPLSLRAVFDTAPIKFTVADTSTSKSYMDHIRKLTSSQQTGYCSIWMSSMFNSEKTLELAREHEGITLPAYCSLPLSSEILLTNDSVPQLSTQCACYERQLRQLARLLWLEEAAMERDIKEHDLLNVHMEYHNVLENQCTLEVPGLPENRPSLFVGDVVYVRRASDPREECAALVLAIETQPRPKVIIKLTKEFLSPLISGQHRLYDDQGRVQRLKDQYFHVRFMIDRLILKNMHSALERTARSTTKLLPCLCSGIIDGREHIGNVLSGVDSIGGSSTGKPNSRSGREDNERQRKMVLINEVLNVEQQVAIKAVLDRVHGPGPYIIFGPPGTGKTVTVVECVLQVLMVEESPLLCVCAPSNYAADILCSGIASGGVTPAQMWRLNDPRRISSSVKPNVLPFCTSTNGVYNYLHPYPSGVKVIVCTCAAAAVLHEDPLKFLTGSFTHILIDEAGQALTPEALIPLSLAKHATCWLLCGDPRQLGPVVHSKLAATNGLAKSLLEQFMVSPEFRLEPPAGAAAGCITKLLRNYRANSKLLDLPSTMFYGNELISSAEGNAVAPPLDWEEMQGRDFPMLFYGVNGKQMREGESPSYFNPVETTKVVDLITGLLRNNRVTTEDIGVMAPFRLQVQKLRLVLRSKGLRAVRVGTVDDYQGQEEKIIFISTVLTKPESLKRAQAGGGAEQNVGFLSNAKRFNVAITRAKAMLVVVGHPVILSKDNNWQQLLRYCWSRGAFRGYGSDRVPSFLCSDPLSSAGTTFTIPKQQIDDATSDAKENKEIASAIELIAEMSLLGLGDGERIFPDNLDSYYEANSEDLQWRVVL